jgi:predicted amidohydrolase
MANWPETRGHHWRQLLLARAIENQAYVAGVNRVGEDGLGFFYNGDTAIVDFAGNLLCQAAQVEGVFTIALSLDKLKGYREKLQFLADRDDFKILF